MSADFNPPQAWETSHPIERAAHLFGCFYASKAVEICEEEGITAKEMRAGIFLDAQRRDQRYRDRAAYGSPEYGYRSGCAGRPYLVGEFYE